MIRFVTGRPGGPPQIHRREWLRIGGLAGLGGVAGTWPSVATAARPGVKRSPGFGRAKSVIVVYANGGQSQPENWGPNPDAPAEIRGEFRAIRSAVPGTLLSEHLPRLARLADRY